MIVALLKTRTLAWGAGALLMTGLFAFCLAPASAAPGRVCLEAEAGRISKPVVTLPDNGCSGGSCIEVPEGVNPKAKEGEAPPTLMGDSIIKFKVTQAGNYTLWGRAWWLDGCGNSFDIFVNGNRVGDMSDGNYKRWHWVKVGKVRLEPGKVYTLKIANSEDGARLDQIFMTTDPMRIPVGKERVTPTAYVK